MFRRLALIAVFAASFAFAQDIPPTTFNTVTVSGDAAQSANGDGYVFSVTETNSIVPYIRLTVTMKNGASVTQLVANTKTVNRVFVLTPSPVFAVTFQELAGPPQFTIGPFNL